jgi:hypothetical protein
LTDYAYLVLSVLSRKKLAERDRKSKQTRRINGTYVLSPLCEERGPDETFISDRDRRKYSSLYHGGGYWSGYDGYDSYDDEYYDAYAHCG